MGAGHESLVTEAAYNVSKTSNLSVQTVSF